MRHDYVTRLLGCLTDSVLPENKQKIQAAIACLEKDGEARLHIEGWKVHREGDRIKADIPIDKWRLFCTGIKNTWGVEFGDFDEPRKKTCELGEVLPSGEVIFLDADGARCGLKLTDSKLLFSLINSEDYLCVNPSLACDLAAMLMRYVDTGSFAKETP